MGKYKKGILGSFNGLVGTVVGSTWRGIDYMKSRPVGNKSNTSAQIAHRLKFRLIGSFLRTMRNVLDIGYSEATSRDTAINRALGYNIKNAITGEYPDLAIDYSKVLVSRGSLPKTLEVNLASSMQAGQINFSWVDDSGISDAKATDKAILVAYCPEVRHVIYTLAGPTRDTGTGTLSASAIKGRTVHTWLAFITADGKFTSDSTYTGMIQVS